MNDSSSKLTRGQFIVLPALAGLLAAAAIPAAAQTPKGSKTQFKYQDTPSDGKKCSGCTFYIPGKSATANGTCKIVDGDISPNGYCIAYSAKSG